MAVIGTVIGEITALLLLAYISYKRFGLLQVKQHLQRNPSLPIIKEVTWLSLSVSMSGLLLLGYQLVDSFTIYSSLIDNGMTPTIAKSRRVFMIEDNR